MNSELAATERCFGVPALRKRLFCAVSVPNPPFYRLCGFGGGCGLGGGGGLPTELGVFDAASVINLVSVWRRWWWSAFGYLRGRISDFPTRYFKFVPLWWVPTLRSGFRPRLRPGLRLPLWFVWHCLFCDGVCCGCCGLLDRETPLTRSPQIYCRENCYEDESCDKAQPARNVHEPQVVRRSPASQDCFFGIKRAVLNLFQSHLVCQITEVERNQNCYQARKPTGPCGQKVSAVGHFFGCHNLFYERDRGPQCPARKTQKPLVVLIDCLIPVGNYLLFVGRSLSCYGFSNCYGLSDWYGSSRCLAWFGLLHVPLVFTALEFLSNH
jgi:hypothetical protein